jgi:tRNA G10  N-methylase Trm11
MRAQNPAGLHALVDELGKRLTLGESFDNRQPRELSNQFLGGTRGQGVWMPRDAYDALEVAVNKVLFETMAAELMGNDAEALCRLRAFVSRLPTQSDHTHEQNELQQFSTPPTLAFIAATLLDVKSGDTVLEPSAGAGSLAIWARARAARVVCNEIHPQRRELLQSILGFEIFAVDAEIIDDVLPREILSDAVLMNPPFTATGKNLTLPGKQLRIRLLSFWQEASLEFSRRRILLVVMDKESRVMQNVTEPATATQLLGHSSETRSCHLF